MKSTEKSTQAAILEWLGYRRIFHYRNNSGGFRDANKHFYRFGALGSPDIVCVIGGIYVGIEVKDLKGRQNPNQVEFQSQLEKAGGIYVVARSIEDVEAALSPLVAGVPLQKAA
jgi:hypothetical protein